MKRKIDLDYNQLPLRYRTAQVNAELGMGKISSRLAPNVLDDIYRRLTGEMQANTVMKRKGLSQAELDASSPFDDYLFGPEDAIEAYW